MKEKIGSLYEVGFRLFRDFIIWTTGELLVACNIAIRAKHSKPNANNEVVFILLLGKFWFFIYFNLF